MPRLTAAALAAILSLLAGAAGAATQADIICPHWNNAWANARASGNVHRMQAVANGAPGYCPVKAAAKAAIRQLATQYATAHRPSPTPTSHDASPDRALDVLASQQPPGPPAEPCSVAGVQARFPQVPLFRSDAPAATVRSRSDLADQYVERGEAFEACDLDSQALGDFRDAVALDPKSFDAFDAEGDLALKGDDDAGAIDAYSRAIAVKQYISPDANPLVAYAGRAEAEEVLQRYQDEIGDLRFVTLNYPNYNAAQQNDLEASPYYHEMLGKALYLTHDDAAAAAELALADRDELDWQDLRFLAGRAIQAKDWPGAVALLQQALAGLPDNDPAKRRESASLEVMMAQAYLANKDPTNALAQFKAAEADDPNNADARAGHQSIGDPPPPPTFAEPHLQPVTMPADVTDLAHDSPPPFCGPPAKYAYLDTIAAANDAVNANITEIGRVSYALLTRRADYNADTRLAFDVKNDDLRLFDDELTKLRHESATLQDEGNALGAFWHRVSDDHTNVITCRAAASAAGGR